MKVVDAAGNEAIATLPGYVIQSASWRTWEIALADFVGVDLTTVAALTIGVGDGTGNSGQADLDIDTIYLDNIRLGYLPAEQ